MQAYFANQSCDPFLAESRPCTLGNYVSYAIKASSSAQVAKAVKFATKYNIRLVVRNTGHEYVSAAPRLHPSPCNPRLIRMSCLAISAAPPVPVLWPSGRTT